MILRKGDLSGLQRCSRRMFFSGSEEKMPPQKIGGYATKGGDDMLAATYQKNVREVVV